MLKSAFVSNDGLYRYTLLRSWSGVSPVLTLIMLNPSTADAEHDDSTILRCIAHAQHNGYGAIHVLNLFAWRATKPEELTLRRDVDVVGPDNNYCLRHSLQMGRDVLCAWGTKFHDLHGRSATVKNLIKQREGGRVFAIKLSKDGHPCHPLYMRLGPFIPFPL